MTMEQYTKTFDALPAALQTPARKAALAQLLQQGLPNSDAEEWKYTDLSGLASFAPPAVSGAASVQPAASDKLEDGFDALNAAFAEQGLDLDLNDNGSVTAIGFDAPSLFGPQFLHRRNRIRVAANVEVTLLLRSQPQQIGTQESFASLFTELSIGENAKVTLIRIQDEAPDRTLVERLNAKLARHARLHMVSVDLGGKIVRNDTNVELLAEGAEVHLHGLYAPAGSTHVDNHTRIGHRAPHCVSREFYRGVIGEAARAVFNGRIVVHEGARKTDSEQRVANLLLSPKAEVNAKPELEIYNDDVKCAHGATFGQLDDTAIFYLRSRGLPLDAARSLLTYAFACEVLDQIPQPELRNAARQAFLSRLPDANQIRDLL